MKKNEYQIQQIKKKMKYNHFSGFLKAAENGHNSADIALKKLLDNFKNF